MFNTPRVNIRDKHGYCPLVPVRLKRRVSRDSTGESCVARPCNCLRLLRSRLKAQSQASQWPTTYTVRFAVQLPVAAVARPVASQESHSVCPALVFTWQSFPYASLAISWKFDWFSMKTNEIMQHLMCETGSMKKRTYSTKGSKFISEIIIKWNKSIVISNCWKMCH